MARVVVSHSSRDTDVAARVHRWLVGAGHEVVRDADPVGGVPVGDEWRDRLWERLRQADALVCVVTESYRASATCSAEISAALSRGVLVLPLLADSGERHPLLKAVEHLALPPDADDHADGAPLRLLGASAFMTAAAGWSWPVGESPFPGLDAFDVNRQKVFFGRDGEIRALTRAVARPASDGMLLVVGPSGCGKSSLVRAGLIPRLSAQPDWWTVPAFRPETDPVTQLAVGLARAGTRLGLDWSARSVLNRLRADGLPGVVADLLAGAPGPVRRRRLLLVVDQFEQLFTVTPPPQRAEFVDLLRPVVPGTVTLLGALRTEFLDVVAEDDALAELAPLATYTLTPLRQARLAVVIRGPAEIAGLRLDDELVEQMVRDTGTGRALPLLAFALQRLTDNAEPGARLTLKDYDRIGGVHGALGKQAGGALDSAHQTTGRSREEILNDLCRLVAIDPGHRPTARTITTTGLPGSVLDHLRCFHDRRLLIGQLATTGTDTTIDVTAGRTRAGAGPVVLHHDHADADPERDPESPGTLRLAHESLITSWKPLQDAVEARRDALRTSRALRLAVTSGEPLWERERLDIATTHLAVRPSLRHPRWLLPGPPRRFTTTTHLDPPSRAFLAACIHRDRRRRARLTAALIAAIALAVLATSQWRQAREQRQVAVARQLMAQAEAVRDADARLSLALGVAAYDLDPTPQAATWLWSSVESPYVRSTGVTGHTDTVYSVAFSADGRTLATAGADRTVILWDLTTPAAPVRIGRPLSGHTGTVYSVAFSRNGNTLATAGHDQTVILWDLADPATPARIGQPLTGHTGHAYSVAFTPDGRTLATAATDGTVILWNHGESPRSPRGSAVGQACAQLGGGLSENEWATYVEGLDYRETCP